MQELTRQGASIEGFGVKYLPVSIGAILCKFLLTILTPAGALYCSVLYSQHDRIPLERSKPVGTHCINYIYNFLP